jgi:alpha-amylase
MAGARDGRCPVIADLLTLAYEPAWRLDGTAVAVDLKATGAAGGYLSLRKTLRFKAGSTEVDVSYDLNWNGPAALDALFAVEWNVGLLAGDAPDRYVLADGEKPQDPRAASEGEFTARMVEAVDGWQRLKARFMFPAPLTVWRYPVWTVSQSEGGFERTYQSTVLVFCFPLALDPGSSCRFGFRHDVIDLK